MPPSLGDWSPEGDLAWFILDAVEQIDLSGFHAVYRNDGWGAAAYDPGMMVAANRQPDFGLCAGFGRSTRGRWTVCLCKYCGCAGRRGW